MIVLLGKLKDYNIHLLKLPVSVENELKQLANLPKKHCLDTKWVSNLDFMIHMYTVLTTLNYSF